MDDANKGHAVSGAASAPQQKKSSRSMLVALLFLGAVGIGAWAWITQGRDRAQDARESSTAPKYIAHLEGFTVNLADPEGSHFLRVTIDLGMDRLPDGADAAKVSQALPIARIRDAILSVLTVSKADELLTPQGKEQLKKNLLAGLNKSVPEIGVREIYFTEFLVQR